LSRFQLMFRDFQTPARREPSSAWRLEAFFGKIRIHLNHGQFDQIRSGSLNRGVDGNPFGQAADIDVLAVDIRKQADSARSVLVFCVCLANAMICSV